MVRLATSNTERRGKKAEQKARGASSKDSDHDIRFSLTHALQTSLDLSVVLEIFFSGVQDFISVSGLSYRLDTPTSEAGETLEIGEKAEHTINYRLASETASLGELTFRRNKPFLESELAVLEMLIGVLHHPLKNTLSYREAVAFSMRDALTGVGNRSAMEACFERELKLALRQQNDFSVLVLDLDHFKKVNDTFGHKNGDITIQHVVKVIRETLRDTDQIFRFGGEEFVVLLHQTQEAEAQLIAERLRENIEATPIKLDGRHFCCTVSIGATVFTGKESAEILFEQADRALYRAKQNGRNQVALWEAERNIK